MESSGAAKTKPIWARSWCARKGIGWQACTTDLLDSGLPETGGFGYAGVSTRRTGVEA
jgi:hypothetical protein